MEVEEVGESSNDINGEGSDVSGVVETTLTAASGTEGAGTSWSGRGWVAIWGNSISTAPSTELYFSSPEVRRSWMILDNVLQKPVPCPGLR